MPGTRIIVGTVLSDVAVFLKVSWSSLQLAEDDDNDDADDDGNAQSRTMLPPSGAVSDSLIIGGITDRRKTEEYNVCRCLLAPQRM